MTGAVERNRLVVVFFYFNEYFLFGWQETLHTYCVFLSFSLMDINSPIRYTKNNVWAE